MKYLAKLSTLWCLLGVHELLALGAFFFALYVLLGLFSGRL